MRERSAIESIATTVTGITALIQDIVVLEDTMGTQREQFIALRATMDDLLDDEIQLSAIDRLRAPRRNMEISVQETADTVRYLIPAYLLFTIIGVSALVSFITRPLRQLTRGVQTVGKGDFSYHIPLISNDELGDVGRQFNRMVDQLRDTTVSKELLAESERNLSNTVYELRREIAERERSERERADLQAALQRSEAMSAMGALVAGVAHEVRNPLFGISSTLDAMDARLGSSDHQRYIKILRGEIDRLSKLMRDLLEYAKPPQPAFAPVPIAEILSAAIAACNSTLEERNNLVKIEQRSANDLVMADHRRLCQVFQNLFENAIHHVPDGSVITVATTRIDSAGTDGNASDGNRSTNWLICSVADHGLGFSLADLPHLFEPFFTRRRGGTGLGLCIAQRIVEQHGGSIEAHNRPDGGAIVNVRLPVSEPGEVMGASDAA